MEGKSIIRNRHKSGVIVDHCLINIDLCYELIQDVKEPDDFFKKH